MFLTLSRVYGRLRAQTPSGGSGPLRRACAPFAAKAAKGCRRQTPAAARGYALFWRSGLRPSLVQGLRPRNAPLQNQSRRGASMCVIAPINPPPAHHAPRSQHHAANADPATAALVSVPYPLPYPCPTPCPIPALPPALSLPYPLPYPLPFAIVTATRIAASILSSLAFPVPAISKAVP